MNTESLDLYLIVLSGVLLTVLVISELYYPARTYESALKGRSYFTNAIVFVFNNIVLFAFQASAVYVLANSNRLYSFFDVFPVWIQVVLGIVLLDFMIWVWHVSNHKILILWRFHKCHHSEQYLNATSAIRFHIGELLLSVVFKAVVLITLGIPFWIFVLYESLITFFAIFHHANIRLPQSLQNKLRFVIITPDMHRTHHSSLRHEHDSNYGIIFSWWDRLLGTYQKVEPNIIGLQNTEEKSFWKMLLFPFKSD
ncbi:MAG: sterol desaturase/sphingolipid hydroxylase (fatty acid hydroxylase superfamily) [Candidatus Azotimanducaceae bacterium]|jgi:sterol desaturase/sphingolipid hydroxylase (fatty acid hydroxylase superfamily)